MKMSERPMVKLCFLLLIALKLDGNIDLSWLLILTPFMIESATEVFISIVTCIYNAIKSFATNVKRNQDCNTRYNGHRLVWDAKTNTMYGPHNKEDNVND